MDACRVHGTSVTHNCLFTLLTMYLVGVCSYCSPQQNWTVLLHCWKQYWALGLDQYGCFYCMLCGPFWVVWLQEVNHFFCDCTKTWMQFPPEAAEMCWHWRLWLTVSFFVLVPRATSGCPPAQDARFGDSADHAVGELPRVLHPRHALHHGRVAHCAGLLRPGWHELSGHLVWWGSRQVSGLSLCVCK